MTMVVVDASAIAAILFGEPQGAAMRDALAGHNLIAPRLLRFEIASTAFKKQRNHPEMAGAISTAVARLPALAVREVDVDAAELVETAGRTGLSTYDAAYLVLSRRLQLPLVTLDGQLQAAARLGVGP